MGVRKIGWSVHDWEGSDLWDGHTMGDWEGP